MTISSKRFKFIFLYSALVLSLLTFSIFMFSGCGKSITKIFVVFHKTEVDGPFHKLIELYNSKNKDRKVKIEAQTSGGGSDYESVVQSKLGNNSVHLINYEGYGNMKKLESRLLNISDLEIVKKLKQLHPDLLDSCMNEKGEIFGFPVGIECVGNLVYRPAFEQIGIDVSTIKTFDQFEEACKKLKAAIQEGRLKDKFPHAKTVFSVWGKDPWSLTNHISHYIVGRDFKNSIEAYNSPTFPFSAADDYRRMIDFQTSMAVEGEPTKEKLASLNTVDYTTAIDGSLLNNRSFVAQLGNWSVPAITEFDSKNKTNLLDSFELLPFFVPNEDKAKLMLLGGQCWGINNGGSEKEIEESKRFLNWMYTDPEAKAIVSDKMKIVSPLISRDELNSLQFDKITKKMIDSYLSGDYYNGGSIGLVRTEDWTLQNNGTALQERLAGKITDAEFDKRIKDGWAQKFAAQRPKTEN